MSPPLAASNSTTETVSVIVSPSSVVTGLSRVTFVSAMVQPGTGITLTEASGVLVGNWMRTLIVLAVSLSFGTRKTTLPKPPCVASGDDTLTCAEAIPAPSARRAAVAAATTPRRADAGRNMDLRSSEPPEGRSAHREDGAGGRGGELVDADDDGEGPGAGLHDVQIGQVVAGAGRLQVDVDRADLLLPLGQGHLD